MLRSSSTGEGESPLPASSCREVLNSVSTEMISSYRKPRGPINAADSQNVGTNWKKDLLTFFKNSLS